MPTSASTGTLLRVLLLCSIARSATTCALHLAICTSLPTLYGLHPLLGILVLPQRVCGELL